MTKLSVNLTPVLLPMVREQYRVVLATRDRLIERSKSVDDNFVYHYERAKMIGMLDVLLKLDFDIEEFKSIYCL